MQPIQNAGNARLFARNLRFRRIAAGASQRKMAAVLGVSRSCYARYELGQRMPPAWVCRQSRPPIFTPAWSNSFPRREHTRMRNKHLELRRRIEDAKLAITDAELFGSPLYGAVLSDVAQAATHRYRRRCRVMTYWDEDPGRNGRRHRQPHHQDQRCQPLDCKLSHPQTQRFEPARTSGA